jgi:hypothetical protein
VPPKIRTSQPDVNCCLGKRAEMKSRQRRSCSAEMKARIALEAIKEQKTIQGIASHYGVHPSQVTNTGSGKRFKERRNCLRIGGRSPTRPRKR